MGMTEFTLTKESKSIEKNRQREREREREIERCYDTW